MTEPLVENYARRLLGETKKSVHNASAAKVTGRINTLGQIFDNPDDARLRASEIKQQVIDYLPEHLEQFESNATRNGIKIHWAVDGPSACSQITEIIRANARPGAIVAKAKSMATEEIHLNKALEKAGFKPVETDLGEFIVQIDDDMPSHIVTPIIHKNRRQIAESFRREGIGGKSDDPATLTMEAREHLRSQFQQAEIGISGVNFALADNGVIVLVENEGNNRFSTTAPRVHIAVMGIEKLLPSASDLPLFLKLLAGSATGQKLTTYVHMIAGPKTDEVDGPEEVHIVLLDNGRSSILNGPYREILKCIRCGACLNVCPVYRQASGHAYRHVYPGPVGAVLAPALEGVEDYGDLPKASTLCGSCEEVCPVIIPIPDMLVRLRSETKSSIDFSGYKLGANNPMLWKAGLKLLPMAKAVAPSGWTNTRSVPEQSKVNFRRWWRERS